MEKKEFKLVQVFKGTIVLFLLLGIKNLFGQNTSPSWAKNINNCEYIIRFDLRTKEDVIFYRDSFGIVKPFLRSLKNYFKSGDVIFFHRFGRFGSYHIAEGYQVNIECVKLINEHCVLKDTNLLWVSFAINFDQDVRSKLGNSIPFDKKKYIATENLIKSCRAKFKKNKLIFKIGRGLFKKRKVILIDSNNYDKMPELIESFIKEKIKLDDYWINFKSTVELGRKMGSNLIIKDNKD